MDPKQELLQWKAAREAFEAKYGTQGHLAPADEIAAYNGDTLSPDAKAYIHGAGVAGQHFDPKTGEITKNKGYWSQPESWIQLGLGGALGAAGAAGALPGALGGATGGAAPAATVASGTGAATAAGASATGGMLSLAKNLAPMLTANAAGRAQGRGVEADINQSGDRNQIALYNALLGNNQAKNAFALSRGNLANANAATDLSQRSFALQAPRQRAGTAVQGDILANAKDATVSGISPNIPVPTINGGLRPSMFSDSTRALGTLMSSQALAGQQKGDTFAPAEPLPTWQNPPAAPSLTPTPEANGLDTALSTGGNILNWAGTFADYLKKYKKPGVTMGSTDDTSSGVYS
jgi:hypothetical protein